MKFRDFIARRIRRVIFRGAWFLYPFVQFYWWAWRPKTLGIKVFVRNGVDVLLVRQGYGTRFWTLPGGGAKTGESLEDAAAREVFEEVGIKLDLIRLFGSFLYTSEYKRDVIWVGEGYAPDHNFALASEEIIEAQWFPMGALPKSSSPLMREFLRLYKPGSV